MKEEREAKGERASEQVQVQRSTDERDALAS